MLHRPADDLPLGGLPLLGGLLLGALHDPATLPTGPMPDPMTDPATGMTTNADHVPATCRKATTFPMNVRHGATDTMDGGDNSCPAIDAMRCLAPSVAVRGGNRFCRSAH